ncbi:MAG: hypothetical protein LAP21_06310 [Acidobacteriia bacterium]|nr:hypothetical protein [Terriglobia bacterium]
MDLSLRPMSTSQILDKTFSLYRENFLLFAGIAALPPACFLVGRFLMLWSGHSMAGATPAAVLAAGLVVFLAVLGLGILWLVGYALASGASVYAVSRFHLGYTTTIAEAYRLVMPYFRRIVGIVALLFLGLIVVAFVLVMVFAVFIGVMTVAGGRTTSPIGVIIVTILVAIPTAALFLYLSAVFSLSIPACVLEKLGVIDSLNRSIALTRGSRGRLVLVNLLAAILSFVMGMVLGIPTIIGVARLGSNAPAMMPFLMWQYVADFIGGCLSFPIATIAVCLIYYDERVRKEAFDLQLMMETVGQQPPAAPPGSPAIG